MGCGNQLMGESGPWFNMNMPLLVILLIINNIINNIWRHHGAEIISQMTSKVQRDFVSLFIMYWNKHQVEILTASLWTAAIVSDAKV